MNVGFSIIIEKLFYIPFWMREMDGMESRKAILVVGLYLQNVDVRLLFF